jgi:integrase
MIRERDGYLEVVVYFGRDAHGREKRRSRGVRGTTPKSWRAARKIERDLLRKSVAARRPDAGKTVNELLDEWLAVARHEKSTRTREAPYLKNQIRPRIGHIAVADLTLARLDALFVELEHDGGIRTGGPDAETRPLAPATCRRIWAILHAALEQAVRWDWIDRNPAKGVRLPELPNPNPNPPDAETIRGLLDLARARDPELLVFARLAAVTGTRRGGVCAVRWTDIDLDRAEIRKSAAVKEADGGHYLGGTKTGAESWAAIGSGTVEMLREHRARVDDRAAEFGKVVRPDGFLFSDDLDGARPISPAKITLRWRRLRDAAGLPPTVQLRQLRHFAATEMLDRGVPLATVSGRLDHARQSTTSDFYAGSRRASDRDAADLMDGLLDG